MCMLCTYFGFEFLHFDLRLFGILVRVDDLLHHLAAFLLLTELLLHVILHQQHRLLPELHHLCEVTLSKT